MSILVQFAIGLILGLGLIVAGMADPAKMLNFLDLAAIPAGRWDASLIFVMAGGIAVAMLGYRLVFARGRPVLAERFALPGASRPDGRLVAGAVLFGIGWGLAGFCPGPALVAALTGGLPALIFLAAMLAGMALARRLAAATAASVRLAELEEKAMIAIPHPVDLSIKPEVTAFFDGKTNTVSYVVKDPGSKACAIIDSVMDIDYAAGRIAYDSGDEIIAHIREHGLEVAWLIETHVHADHLSGAPYIQGKLGGKIGIGERITIVQETFGKVFNEGTEFRRDGSQFDRLFADGGTYMIGGMKAFAMHTPGHTPACMTHVIGDAAFVGDTLFMPDGGSARADFPGGDARTLYRSIKRVLALAPQTRLFMCHDYGPNGRDIRWETTVAEQHEHNIHVRDGISEDEFVKMREARDATLAMPRLIIPSLQVNMKAGELPQPDASGKRFLKVPLNEL